MAKVKKAPLKKRTPEEAFVEARRRLKLPYKPDHVTEEEIKQAVANLPK